MNALGDVVTGLVVLMLLFFWIRGALKSNSSDLCLGVFLLLFSFILKLEITGSPSEVGGILLVFGMTSLVLSPFLDKSKATKAAVGKRFLGIRIYARDNPIRSDEMAFVGAICIILAFFAGMLC